MTLILIADVKVEIVTDASGKQVLRMVQEVPKTSASIDRFLRFFIFLHVFFLLSLAEVTNSDVNANDFEEVVDTKTGKKVLRMKKEVAKRKGFVGIDELDFEVVIDQTTGQQTVQLKSNNAKTGNRSFEMFTDPKTGQQTLRMKEEVDLTCKRSNGTVLHRSSRSRLFS